MVGVDFYYPAGSSGEPRAAPYLPERDDIVAWLAGTNWPDDEARILVEVYGHLRVSATADAPLLGGTGRLPVLLFSHGGYMSRHFYTSMLLEFASHGYLVVAMSHAHAGFDFFPGLGLLARNPRWTAPTGTASRQASDSFYEEMTDALAADARFVLDQLQSLDAGAAETWCAGRIDLERVAILGHSRGGKTVSRACTTDPRFKAAVIYDNLPPQPDRERGFRQPLMMFRVADPDGTDVRSPSGLIRWSPERMRAARALVEHGRSPGYDVAIRAISHFHFSDRALIETERFASKHDPRDTLELIEAYTLAFLDRHLLDRPMPRWPRAEARFPLVDLFRNAAASAATRDAPPSSGANSP